MKTKDARRQKRKYLWHFVTDSIRGCDECEVLALYNREGARHREENQGAYQHLLSRRKICNNVNFLAKFNE